MPIALQPVPLTIGGENACVGRRKERADTLSFWARVG